MTDSEYRKTRAPIGGHRGSRDLQIERTTVAPRERPKSQAPPQAGGMAIPIHRKKSNPATQPLSVAGTPPNQGIYIVASTMLININYVQYLCVFQ